MRVSTACIVCRQRKVKCVHQGKPPCNHCRNIGNVDNCVLYTTKEYSQVRGPGTKRKISTGSNKLELKKSIEFALQHYPELFFLNSYSSREELDTMDTLLILSMNTLASLFDKTLTEKEKKERYINLETQFMSILEDNKADTVLIMQCSIILLIINWQKGKTYKGYLVGGIAERAYKTLFDLSLENDSISNNELCLRTIWSYQLITLSLREESIEVVKSRLHKFRLPIEDPQCTSENAESPVYVSSITNGKNHNLTSLLIMSSEVWIDCLAWLVKGGKFFYKEAPWDPNSAWNKLEQKIQSFHDALGEKEKFSYSNLVLSFVSGKGNIYCSMHLTLMISGILIHREFIPFIPSDTDGAKGPYDKLPWLSEAPSGWWQQSATSVFEAAKNVSIILDISRQNGKYSCNTFNGFIALTAASILSYIKHFPYYDSDFKDAGIYYGYCNDYLLHYKSFLGIGLYYNKILMQTEKIFDLATKKGVSALIITLFEQMKREVLDIANVSGPVNDTCNSKVDDYFYSERKKLLECFESEQPRGEQCRQEMSSLMNWDLDWLSMENCSDLWTLYMEDLQF